MRVYISQTNNTDPVAKCVDDRSKPIGYLFD